MLVLVWHLLNMSSNYTNMTGTLTDVLSLLLFYWLKIGCMPTLSMKWKERSAQCPYNASCNPLMSYWCKEKYLNLSHPTVKSMMKRFRCNVRDVQIRIHVQLKWGSYNIDSTCWGCQAQCTFINYCIRSFRGCLYVCCMVNFLSLSKIPSF